MQNAILILNGKSTLLMNLWKHRLNTIVMEASEAEALDQFEVLAEMRGKAISDIMVSPVSQCANGTVKNLIARPSKH